MLDVKMVKIKASRSKTQRIPDVTDGPPSSWVRGREKSKRIVSSRRYVKRNAVGLSINVMVSSLAAPGFR